MGLDITHLIVSVLNLAMRISKQKENKKKRETAAQIRRLKISEETKENSKKRLDKWLSHPNELGFSPENIEYTYSFIDKDGIRCIIFKYRETPKSKWLLGIVSDSGVFSEMQEYKKDTEIEDAIKILERLKSYWKKKAQEIKRN